MWSAVSYLKLSVILQDVLLPHELEWLHQKAHFPTAASQVN